MNYVGLAPMEGFTDLPARLWYGLVSAPEFQCSPFLRLTDTFPNDIKEVHYRWAEIFAPPDCVPYTLHPQVMATSTNQVIAVSTMLGDQVNFLELNCGCPAPLATAKGAGSSLLKDPHIFIATIQKVSTQLGTRRLAVKMRTGYDNDLHFKEMISGIADLHLRHLVVHGRTKEQRYTGLANWGHIGWAAANVSYPVMGSGDLQSLLDLREKKISYPDVEGALIGRGAMRNPWVFSEVRGMEGMRIERDSLIYALAVFALLHDWYDSNFQLLERALHHNLFSKQIENTPSAWSKCYGDLCHFALGSTPDPRQLQTTRGSTKRLKQLWRSLRTSLSPSLMNSTILKQPTVGAMLQEIESHCLELECPVVRNEHDWMFNGEGKIPPVLLTTKRSPAF